jgi:hypothetical protein
MLAVAVSHGLKFEYRNVHVEWGFQLMPMMRESML